MDTKTGQLHETIVPTPSKSLIEDFDRHCFIPIPAMVEVSASLERLHRYFGFAQYVKGAVLALLSIER